MENKQIVEAILESLRSEISEFVEDSSKITDSIEYEERVLEISKKLAQGLITQTQGVLPKSRNLKKKC